MEEKLILKKLKSQIYKLRRLQVILEVKHPHIDFLDPTINNAIISLINICVYLERKSPYYNHFSESLYNHMNTAMNRHFFTDLLVDIEEGLIEIIKKGSILVIINKQKQANKIAKTIKDKVQNISDISKELKDIIKLGGNTPSFNDHLNSVLNHFFAKNTKYIKSCRCYFDALSIIRNRVSHPDRKLTENERQKLITGHFKNAISEDCLLQMTFEGYESIFLDIVKFFDKIYSLSKM